MSDPQPPRLFVAAKGFVMHRGKVLVVRESKKYEVGTHVGHYGLPGGRLNPGEAFSDGLRREVREETGLDVTIGLPLLVSEWRPIVKGEPWQIVGIFVECASASDEVLLGDEHDEYRWIDPADHRTIALIENEHEAFENYLKRQVPALHHSAPSS